MVPEQGALRELLVAPGWAGWAGGEMRRHVAAVAAVAVQGEGEEGRPPWQRTREPEVVEVRP